MGRYFMFIITEGAETNAFLYPRRKFSQEDLSKINEFLDPHGKGDSLFEDNIFVTDKAELDDESVFLRESEMIEVSPENLVGKDISRVYIINTNDVEEEEDEDDE